MTAPLRKCGDSAGLALRKLKAYIVIFYWPKNPLILQGRPCTGFQYDLYQNTQVVLL